MSYPHCTIFLCVSLRNLSGLCGLHLIEFLELSGTVIGRYSHGFLPEKSVNRMDINPLYMAWKEENDRLKKTFTFPDFTHAFGFMTKVAIVAEKMNHHPTWTNTWNTVNFELSTHDAGNKVTDKDRKLADAIDRLA
jgi:4a-hydroxytetrahydrobiopterin dehydratase